MNHPLCCTEDGRRAALLAAKTLNGIDFVEVDLELPPALTKIEATFLFDLAGGGGGDPKGVELTEGNVLVRGGVRFRDPKVKTVKKAGAVLTVTMADGQIYDNSLYELVLSRSPTDAAADPPDGFDPELSVIAFSFKAGCPSDLDCRTGHVCPPQVWPNPPIDYLAKDYDSFRRLMLDRFATLVPGWTERSAADQTIMLVEMLAYVGDQHILAAGCRRHRSLSRHRPAARFPAPACPPARLPHARRLQRPHLRPPRARPRGTGG